MATTTPRDGATWRGTPEPPDLRDQWTDSDCVIRRADQRIRFTAYLAKAYPKTWGNLSPVSMAGYLSTGVDIRPDTVWQSPIVEDWNDFEPRFDPDNDLLREVERWSVILGPISRRGG